MLNETVRLLLKRWPLVVATFMVSVLAGFAGWNLTPLQYQSESQVLFLPPTQQAGVEGKTNPFLFFGASLGITADIVRINVSDDDSRTDLIARGAVRDYEVRPYLAENGGPILIVSAKSGDGAQTQATVGLVAQAIQDDLDAVQNSAKAPGTSRITATVLTQTAEAKPIYKNRIRLSVVLGVLGFALLLAIVVLVEWVRASGWRRGADDDGDGQRMLPLQRYDGGDLTADRDGDRGLERHPDNDGDRVPATRS